ncbi:MAG: hypothetical protein ABSG31_14275 [Tepidisphaeraceae bacterium]
MPAQLVKYAPILPGERLHQGEILAGVIHVRQSLDSIGTERVQTNEIAYPYAIVLTQDCDLSQDATARETEARALQNPSLMNDEEFRKKHDNGQKHKIENIICCTAQATGDLKSLAAQQKDLWKRVTQNLDIRFQCLEAVPAEQDSARQGLPSLGCDFRRFFTVPTDEIYKRIELGQIARRTHLVTPYAEHLLYRFCNFQARVPLPENHNVPL